MMTYAADYPPADIEFLMNGLEELAVTGKARGLLRPEAAQMLGLVGSTRSWRPQPGVFARLARVYRRSGDDIVRASVLTSMGELVDRGESEAFLEHVAAQPVADFPGASARAITALLLMEDEGRAALRRLHESRAVRDPEARADLATLARNGYRLP